MQVLAAFPLNIAYNAGYMHIAPVQMRPVCILPGPLLLLRRFLLRRWWFLSRHVLYYTLLQHQQVVCAVGFCLDRGRRNTAVKLCFAHDDALDSVTPPIDHVVQVATIHQPRTATVYCLDDVDHAPLLLSMLAGVDHHQVECEDVLSPSVGVQLKVCCIQSVYSVVASAVTSSLITYQEKLICVIDRCGRKSSACQSSRVNQFCSYNDRNW